MIHFHQKSKSILILLLTTILVSFSYAEKSRGKLSEAIKKSNDDYEGERKVADTQESDDDDGSLFWFILDLLSSGDDDDHDVSDGIEDDDDNDYYEPEILEVCHRSIGLSLFGGFHRSLNYSQFAGFNFQYSFAFNPKRIHSFKFGYHRFPIPENSYLYGSVPNLSNLSLGYQMRYYFAPEHIPVNPFLAFGVDGKYLFWRYNNPIYTDVYDEYGFYLMTEEISSDGILNISSSIGTGVTFLRTKRLNTSIGIHLGGTVYRSETVESFENDVFFPDFFARLNVTIEFSFK